MRFIVFSLSLLALSGCAASIPPVEVTRFHLGQQPASGPVVIEAAEGQNAASLEFGTYAAAVSRELIRLGFPLEGKASYRIVLGFERAERQVAKRSPVTIGIGGGSFGGNIGIGLGTSFGVGKSTSAIIGTHMSVQMKRIADGAVVWEGRAQTEAPAKAPAAQPGLAADKLTRALFQDFPGESGRTIIVP
jgi:hypothetical protein